MTRQEKIEFLKQVEKGNHEELNRLREQEENQQLINESIWPCFHYLVEEGRILTGNSFQGLFPIVIEDFQSLKNALDSIKKDNDYSILTDRELEIISEVVRSIEYLINTGGMHLLNPYKEI